MARIPSERSVGAFGVAANVQYVSLVAGSIVDGDLLIATLGCDVASNGNMGANWTRVTEVATGGFTASIFTRWGLSSDSGDTFVCSYSGAGGASTLKHGFITAIQDVHSQDLTTVLHGLKTRVSASANFIATASYQTDSTSDTVWASLIQGDNIAVASAGFVNAGWTFVASRGSATGNDGQQYLLKRTVATSGTFVNPASSALGTSHEWRSFSWGLDAEPETFTSTADDDVDPATDDLPDYHFRWVEMARSADDAHDMTDEPLSLRELLRLHADELAFDDGAEGVTIKVADVEDLLELLDSMAADKTTDTVIVSYVGEDTVELPDGTEQRLLAFRLYEDVLELSDEPQSARMRVLWSTDTLAIAPDDADFIADTEAESLLELFDELTASVSVSTSSFVDDAITLSDESVRVTVLMHQLEEAVVLADEAQLLRFRTMMLDDDISLFDAVVAGKLCGAVTGDAVTITDESLARRALLRSNEDALAIIDESLNYKQCVRILADDAGITDLAEFVRDARRLVASFLDVADEAIALAARNIIATLDDALAAEDYVQAFRVFGRFRHDMAELREWDFRLGDFREWDEIFRSTIRNKHFTDELTATDATLWLRHLARMVDDALASDDSAIVLAARNIHATLTDEFITDDAVAKWRLVWRAHADDIEVLDAATAYLYRRLHATLDDGAVIIDAVAAALLRLRAADDAVTTFDAALLLRDLRRWASDAIESADEALAAVGRNISRALDDSTTIDDAALRLVVAWRMMADDVAALDAALIARYNVIADALAPTDEQLRAMTRGTVRDSVLVVEDSASWFRLLARAATDLLDAADTVLVVAARSVLATVEDAVAIEDAAQRLGWFWREASEALTTVDEALAARYRRIMLLLEDGVAAEDAVFYSAYRGAVLTEVLTLSDATQWLLRLERAAADALAVDDAVLVAAARNLYAVMDDAFELSDAALRALAIHRLAADDIAVLDAALAEAFKDYVATLDDAVTVTADARHQSALTRAVTSALAGADDLFLHRWLYRAALDSLPATDAADAARAMSALLNDAVAMFDEALSALAGFTLRVVEDGVELSDATQRILLRRSTIEDGFALNDDAVRALRWARLFTDGFDVVDERTGGASAFEERTVGELLVVEDATDLYHVHGRDAVSAIVQLTDAAYYAKVRGLIMEDAATADDDAFSVLRRVLLAADALELVDGALTLRMYARELFDLFDVTDALDVGYFPVIRYDFRIMIGASPPAKLGHDEFIYIGHDRLAELGHNEFAIIGAERRPAVELGGYN